MNAIARKGIGCAQQPRGSLPFSRRIGDKFPRDRRQGNRRAISEIGRPAAQCP